MHWWGAWTRPRPFDTKIAVVVRDDLPTWQRLNMTAFLVERHRPAAPEVIGEPYSDADDTPYLPMFRQPVLVFEADGDLTTAHRRAVERGLPVAVFTTELFRPATTGTTARRSPRCREELDLAGIAVYGPRNAVDKIVKGARMHP